MKFKPLKRAPVILTICVLILTCGLRLLNPDFLERFERITYDLRMRTALRFPTPTATNLAFVAMEDSSIAAVKNGFVNNDKNKKLGYKFGLYWPRQVYGRVVEELSAQGAQTIAFDVLFGELRNDHPPVQMTDGRLMESDDFFALQMRRASNVVIAVTPDLHLPDLFATNALALGDISTEKDSDGTLRRVEAFHMYRRWHPLFQQIEATPELAVDLTNAIITPGKITLPQTGTTNAIVVPVDSDNNFELADFGIDKLPPGVAPKAKAFTDERVWHMGVVLAARALKLDLVHAKIDLAHGRITLPNANGIGRVIPVDADGYFYIDWRLTPQDPHLLRAPVETILLQDTQRLRGETNELSDAFRGKIVIIGSTAQGNDLTDRGATPLEKDTFLVSKHWNVANSIITGEFIRRTSLPVELGLIIFLGLLTALMTWQLRAFSATGGTLLFLLGYVVVVFFAFAKSHYWLPVMFPLLGAVMEHVSLVTYRAVFEEREQRRVKSIFSKIVAPDVVNELLDAKKLSFGGTRREMTVFFADVRGFTALTDETHKQSADFVREQKLDSAAAEKCIDESARQTLNTVNLYLAAVADTVISRGGTLDKYIGDCVMAFWGAPLENRRHATACVRAAIDAQRAIQELNRRRVTENASLDTENITRQAAGLPPKPPLRALQLGTGINTGFVTVGLMGSEKHQYSYTVFGREVNVASRLEGVSGSGRIIISETTHQHLLRDDPEIAAICVELPAVTVKGIKETVRIYEVPWQNK